MRAPQPVATILDAAPDLIGPDCPQCGRAGARVTPYDFGVCSETGYCDAGEWWECGECGAIKKAEESHTEN